MAALALLVLPSCGGGGSEGEQPDPQSPAFSWRYTALGDSLAFGVGADRGYVPRYRGHLQSDNNASVALTNLGVPGWKSADLLDAIRNNGVMRVAVMNSEVVTWNIGGNDLSAARNAFKRGDCGGADNQECIRTAVARFQQNWDALVAEILSLRARQTTILRTMDIYYPFVAEDKADGDFAVLNPYLQEVNAYIRASGERNGIPIARVNAAFNGADGTEDPGAKGLLASDVLHANDNGHTLIADALRALGYTPLN